jgi:hypothetical protein
MKPKKLVASLGLIGLLMNPIHARSENVTPFFDFKAGYEQNLVRSVSNIPLSIRDVPPHKGDYGSYGDGTQILSKDNVVMYDRIPLEARAGITLNTNCFKPSLGLGIGYTFEAANPSVKEDLRTCVSEKYQGAINFCEPRPDMYYYQIRNDPLRIAPFLEVEKPLDEKTSLILGYRVFRDVLNAENGWDVQEDSSSKNKFKLAQMVMGESYAGIKSQQDGYDLLVEAGLSSCLNKDITSLGRNAKITFKNHPLSIRAGARFKINFEEILKSWQ